MTRPLAQIRESATASLRQYPYAEPGARTAILRDVAAALVEAREHFFTADGTTDWRGRTYAYRQFAGEVFSGANLPPEEGSTVQAAVRYHTGNLLRERLGPDEVEALGLNPESPKERSVAKRALQSSALQVLRGGEALQTPAEVAQAVRVASALLGRVDTDAVRSWPASARAAIAEETERVAALASGLALTAAARRRK